MNPLPAILEQPIARQILGYLMRYPRANDTREGIVKWWLLEQRVREWLAEGAIVLDELVRSKLVLARRGTDGQVHYRLNPGKKAQIEKYLQDKPPAGAAPRKSQSPPTEKP
jgi:hypothetical protein